MNNNSEDIWNTLYEEVVAHDEDLDGTISELPEWNYSPSDILRLLDHQDDSGNTLLHYAIDGPNGSDVWTVSRLLDEGANPNIVNNEGYTPLLSAVEEGAIESIQRLLLDPRIDLWMVDPDGRTARDLALHKSYVYTTMYHRIQDAEMMIEIADLIAQVEAEMEPIRRRQNPTVKSIRTRRPGGARKRTIKRGTKRSTNKRSTNKRITNKRRKTQKRRSTNKRC